MSAMNSRAFFIPACLLCALAVPLHAAAASAEASTQPGVSGSLTARASVDFVIRIPPMVRVRADAGADVAGTTDPRVLRAARGALAATGIAFETNAPAALSAVREEGRTRYTVAMP